MFCWKVLLIAAWVMEIHVSKFYVQELAQTMTGKLRSIGTHDLLGRAVSADDVGEEGAGYRFRSLVGDRSEISVVNEAINQKGGSKICLLCE